MYYSYFHVCLALIYSKRSLTPSPPLIFFIYVSKNETCSYILKPIEKKKLFWKINVHLKIEIKTKFENRNKDKILILKHIEIKEKYDYCVRNT